MDFKPLGEALRQGETWILDRLLTYTGNPRYAGYDSAHPEFWRQTVENLSQTVIQGTLRYRVIPSRHPGEDGPDDPFSAFAAGEAQRQQARGTTLAMFLGLMKYCRQSYRDYLEKSFSEFRTKTAYTLFLDRCFDRIEIGIAGEWNDKGREEEIRQKAEEGAFRLTRDHALANAEQERQWQWAEDKLIQTSNLLKTLFEASPLPIATLDREANVLMWNPAAEKVFGWREEEIVNRLLPIVPENLLPEFFEKHRQAFAGQVFSGLQVQRQTKDGRLLDLVLFNAPLYDAHQNVHAVMAILMDVTEQKKSLEEIAFLAHHDKLTGLANRTLLAERFDQAIAHARRTGTRLAMCAIDLDEFKDVNDLLGHLYGDELLCQIADRLRDSVRRTDTVCRMGGDEFLILFEDLAEMTILTTLIRKISEVFEAPFKLNGLKHSITLSMGVAVFPEDGTDFETLFKNADAAMYFAKETGRNNVQFFRREIRNQIEQRLAVEQGLRQALANRELSIHYQPVCQVAEDRIVGAEALIRWQHPEWGWVPPSHFIPIAEEANLIQPLGEWIFTEVCRTLRKWDLKGLPGLPVAVNVSAKQLFNEGFPAFIARTLRRFGLSPQRLELEVTENLFLENLASVEAVMRELKRIGVGLALDDFGTGYSSLSYLKRFRIDKLKIDRSFISDVCHDEQDAILTDAIILMGRSLGLKVVAEGVETRDQLGFLRRRLCDLYQGYLCSPPLPAQDFAAFVLRRKVQRTLHLA